MSEDTVDPVEEFEPKDETVTPKEDDEDVGAVDIYNLTQKDLSKLTEAYIEKITPVEFVKKARQSGTLENIITGYIENPSEEADRLLNYIKRANLKDDETFGPLLYDADGKVRLGATSIFRPTKVYKGPIRGRNATLAFKARVKGTVRRIQTLGTGVNFLLRAPSINDLISSVERLYNEDIAYGRELGACYYSFADFIAKRQAIDLFVDLILDSSLKGWEEDDRKLVLSTVKITDLNGIMQNIAAMMYPKGFKDFRSVCMNSECGHVAEGITADLTKFIHHRYAALPEDCIKFLQKTKNTSGEVELSELDDYNRKIGLDGQTLEIGEYRYTLKVPTLDEYLKVGAQVIGDIIADVQGASEDMRYMAISSRDILTFLPWISKIEVLNYDESDPTVEPEVQMYSDDTESISSLLMMISDDPDAEANLKKAILTKMDEAQLTLVCFSPSECESCGHIPETSSGMVTLDPLTAFFTQASWMIRKHFMRKVALSQSEES